MDLGILLITVLIGAAIAGLVWSLSKNNTKSNEEQQPQPMVTEHKEKKQQDLKPKKKVPVHSGKDSKAQFTHTWLLTTLKGHTGSITDLDFSANGKHLATCSEGNLYDIEEREPYIEELDVDDAFVSQTSTETPTPSETDSGCVLSRRQKRNRKKKEQKPSNTKKETTNKQRMRKATPLKYYTRLQMKNSEIYSFLSQYVLHEDQLINLGYPVESAFYPDRAIIYKTPEANAYFTKAHLGEFNDYQISEEKPPLSPSLEKRCVRCRKGFFVTLEGEYLTEERCIYHWGQSKRANNGNYTFSCCQGIETSAGCAVGDLHVWNGVSSGMNGPYSDYVRTRSSKKGQAVYALDCEMCYTGRGLEVCKVSVIGIDGALVYESLVKPERKVVDYNTRFSGIDGSHLKRATKTIGDVQRDLLTFIHAQTILIGHGLENDLRALRIIHSNIIDTAVLFPHYLGFPYRRSLKSLVAAYLQKDIQTSHDGHDSFEDARACAELVLWKAACQLRRHKSEQMS